MKKLSKLLMWTSLHGAPAGTGWNRLEPEVANPKGSHRASKS